MKKIWGEVYPRQIRQGIFVFIQEAIVMLMIISPLIPIFLQSCFNFYCQHVSYWQSTILIPLSFLAIYGTFVEPQIIRIKTHHLDIKGLDKKFRIVFFTDIHVGPHKRTSFVKRVVKKVNNLRADLIFIGGDFTTGSDWHPKHLSPFKQLESNYPIVAVLGNHDYNLNFAFETPRPTLAKKVVEKLESLDIKVLRNESLKINFGGESNTSSNTSKVRRY